VSERPALPLKLYYRIGEVATVVGVETHVLRYWETEFPTIRPQKSSKGHRVYSRKDVEKLIRVKQLLYSEGYTVQGAKRRLQELSRTRIGPDGSSLLEVASAKVAPTGGALTEAEPAQIPLGAAAAKNTQAGADLVLLPAEPRLDVRSVLPIRAIARAMPAEPNPARAAASEAHLREALLAVRATLLDELATFPS
jgi:DNA-binding transcriptional MerR regulator